VLLEIYFSSQSYPLSIAKTSLSRSRTLS
jgi:hypothetical protein